MLDSGGRIRYKSNSGYPRRERQKRRVCRPKGGRGDLTLLHKDFPDPLNVLVIAKPDTRSHKRTHVVLFPTNLALSPSQLTDYYALRFQIEFNFRDAKQYFGLEDFMNVSQPAVTYAVGLAFLMVNLSAILLLAHRANSPDFSVLDLNALFRARRYSPA
jgi:putative transposase